MTTTHLFAELLVIGFGSLVWLAVLGASLFGWDLSQVSKDISLWEVLLPVLSLVYVLGILTDRVADWLFDRLDLRYRARYFAGDTDRFYEARRLLVYYGDLLWSHLEYGRSRMRICRGSALNALVFLISINIAWARAPASDQPGLLAWAVSDLALLGMTALCVLSWRKLTIKEYLKTQRQSTWLEEQLAKRGPRHEI